MNHWQNYLSSVTPRQTKRYYSHPRAKWLILYIRHFQTSLSPLQICLNLPYHPHFQITHSSYHQPPQGLRMICIQAAFFPLKTHLDLSLTNLCGHEAMKVLEQNGLWVIWHLLLITLLSSCSRTIQKSVALYSLRQNPVSTFPLVKLFLFNWFLAVL